MSAILSDSLSHFYGHGPLRKQILFDIDLDIPEGEIVIVTGPSGSGKTTLLTLIGALRSTQEGDLHVLGKQLKGCSQKVMAELRRNIGFIFQQHNLIAAISSVENVELGLRVTGRYRKKDLRDRAVSILESVGLSERIFHKPEQLSGGQRQRVAIARSLAAEPAMLLADEPTASLDKKSGREVVEHMQRLAREQGTTILLVTHDNRILDVADRIVHLEDGRLMSFTDSVISNNDQMMGLLAGVNEKQNTQTEIDNLSDQEFKSMLQNISEESLRFLEATSLASDHAFQAMLERSLFAFTRKLAQMIRADRASLFLVDNTSESLVLRVTEQLPVHEDIRIPIHSGIAGAVVKTGEPVIIADAYKDDRFNAFVDKKFGYRTKSILAIPIRNRGGAIFAVVQLLNRYDDNSFTQEDLNKVNNVLSELALILESWTGLND
ncbi:MAG: ATP-binding cassette domain-containing protein [Gammaproteobacteria bacterium]|nr:ATP-binding cassette domain-containing protein [Gammaproteobacteria bacterium]